MFFFVSLHAAKLVHGGQGGSFSLMERETTKPVVGTVSGRRLRTLLCIFKLRNFENLNRGNATGRLRG